MRKSLTKLIKRPQNLSLFGNKKVGKAGVPFTGSPFS